MRAPLKSDRVLKGEPRGAYDTRFHSAQEVLLVRWNDSSIVTFATNYDSVTPLGVAQRRGRGFLANIPQPKLVTTYN